ncbi:hypothetical protein [Rhodoferax sp. PAMC 29310]|uniref:hypothetical protein n=1 Tax=Rhodoferax sp. PAMC 29310 TaxID=2822760 RepID=UPI001B327550|nr:hypothetical protein [Rhodoferax sp. PAMC 29310]
MTLASTTLAAIQQAGAAVYAADADLKQATQSYAERVTTAMDHNPFGLGNDALFENWKLVARLSQSMGVIEAELKKIYFLAEDLVGEGTAVVSTLPALSAPVAETPTDVVAKSTARTGARRRLGDRRTGANRLMAMPEAAKLPSNAAKLLQHLETALNTEEFRLIKQTASARTIGIPLGSVSAAIKTLLANGHLIAGSAGGFKLKRFDAAEVLV